MADLMEIDGAAKPNKADSLPWVEKYRPSSFTELISHDAIINTCM